MCCQSNGVTEIVLSQLFSSFKKICDDQYMICMCPAETKMENLGIYFSLQLMHIFWITRWMDQVFWLFDKFVVACLLKKRLFLKKVIRQTALTFCGALPSEPLKPASIASPGAKKQNS